MATGWLALCVWLLAGPQAAQFTSPQTQWLTAGRTGAWGKRHALGVIPLAWYPPGLATHAGGFGAPIQHSDGSQGFVRVDDLNYYGRRDSVLVPVPDGGRFTVSCGWLPPQQFGATACYGAYDGKDFIIDDSTGDFYEIDQMYVDGEGQPINHGPWAHGSGRCGGEGEAPCGVRGVFRGNLGSSGANPGGGSAAGVVSGAGDILPGELACATCLNHAVQVVIAPQLNNATTCNAFATGKKGDGSGHLPEALLCEGGFLQYTGDWKALSPQTHSAATIALARALQLYGGFITDQGGPDQGAGGFYCISDYAEAPDLQGNRDLLQHLSVYYGTASLR